MAVTQSASDQQHGPALLSVARRSLEHGLSTGKPLPVAVADFHADLRQPGAAFVTLLKQVSGRVGPKQPSAGTESVATGKDRKTSTTQSTLASGPGSTNPRNSQMQESPQRGTGAWELRGCIGNLTAHQPLIVGVADNAFYAAFRDPRFPPLALPELPTIRIEVSVLTPKEPIKVASEQELLDLLRPGTDGLVLEEGHHRGTFLPAVWEQLPDKQQFIQQLKLKAGLPADYWSQSLKIFRYGTVKYLE